MTPKQKQMLKYYTLMGQLLNYPRCCVDAFKSSYLNDWNKDCKPNQPFFTCKKHRKFSSDELWKLVGRADYSEEFTMLITQICTIESEKGETK